MKSGIVADSSIWQSSQSLSSWMTKRLDLRTGMVRSYKFDEVRKETIYVVEVFADSVKIPIFCIRANRIGGIFNYEEQTYRPYVQGKSETDGGAYSLKTGDFVLVAYLGGDEREGVIVCSLKHPGRQDVLRQDKDDVAYLSVFNGVKTTIDKDGQFRQTFLGQPTNIKVLTEPPKDTPIPEPTYDDAVGTSYYEWDKTGSYTLTDNAKQKPIKLKIDKPNGKFLLDVGASHLYIDKNKDLIDFKNVDTTWVSDTSWSLKTKTMNVDAASEINAKSAKINTEGEWAQKGNVKITGNTEISGDLKNQGQALLAGGANPLIYDIVLTIGTGNLGAPVISNHTFLKTVKTKAT